jgi:hypothetical protein
MTLLTENFPSPIRSVGVEDGSIPGGVAVLDIRVEWNEFCNACNRDCTFVAMTRCADGLNAECSGCGDKRIAPFTRMNSEVA